MQESTNVHVQCTRKIRGERRLKASQVVYCRIGELCLPSLCSPFPLQTFGVAALTGPVDETRYDNNGHWMMNNKVITIKSAHRSDIIQGERYPHIEH